MAWLRFKEFPFMLRKAYQIIFFLIPFCLFSLPFPVLAQASEVIAQPDILTVPVKDIRRFAAVIAQIKRYYISPIEDKDLFDNAIKGMLGNLDPHSEYLDISSMSDLRSVTEGEFGGIGVEVQPEDGFIKVISPLDDSPAQKAGIKAGDLIVRIDHQIVKDMTIKEALDKIRGKKGSTIELTIVRKGEKKPIKISVIRDVIKIQTVKSELLEKGYGYIRIAFFQGPAQKQLLERVEQLKTQSGGQLRGLVLDLRNNPGGLLDSAIEITDQFLDSEALDDNKYIVYTKGRIKGQDVEAKATPGEILKGVPIVVLINEGSASASEIVAGALQDHHRAIILGTRSFGKGSVQTVIPIDNETGIKLTTALYYTPKGRSIQAEGIQPDIMVADLKVPKEETDTVVFDPILEKDLDGHIKNLNTKEKDNVVKQESSVEETEKADQLAHKDFQLYEALMLLKGLNAIRR